MTKEPGKRKKPITARTNGTFNIQFSIDKALETMRPRITGKGIPSDGKPVVFKYTHSGDFNGRFKYVLLSAFIKGTVSLFSPRGGNPIVYHLPCFGGLYEHC